MQTLPEYIKIVQNNHVLKNICDIVSQSEFRSTKHNHCTQTQALSQMIIEVLK